MALELENINNLVTDDLDLRNRNWGAIDTTLTGKADKTYVDGKVQTDVPSGAKFTDTVYSHPTTAGNKHIPTGGASGQVLKYSASGTATWQADNDTITTINGKTGAIAKADIVALGIPAQDTVYTHPTTHSISEVSGLQTALDDKVDNLNSQHIVDALGFMPVSADGVEGGLILGEGPIENGWLFKPVTIADERNE